MIRYSEQHIDHEDISKVVKTLKSDFITTGPKIPEFENKCVKLQHHLFGQAAWSP